MPQFRPDEPARLEAGLLLDGFGLEILAHRQLAHLLVGDEQHLVDGLRGGQQNPAGPVVLDDALGPQFGFGFRVEVPATQVVKTPTPHDDVLHRQLEVFDDGDRLVERLLGEGRAGHLHGVGRGNRRRKHRNGPLVDFLADFVRGRGLDVHQGADVAVLEHRNVDHGCGVDAVGGKLHFVLADFLLLSLAFGGNPVGLHFGLLLVKRALSLGQSVLREQERRDLLAFDFLFDGLGDGRGQRAHPIGGLERLGHQARHRLHVFLAVHVHADRLHIVFLL